MQDVARRAGVSLSTVSYVLSGGRPVTPSTRLRVETAMDELGYQPNAMARGLASRRSHVLALIYPAMERGLGGTVAEFVDAAADAAREAGYHLVLWPIREEQTGEIGDLVRQGMADGILVMEVALEDERIDLLQESGVPYTMIGRTRDVSERPSVDIDFEATVEGAVAHLVELGHRRIAFVNHSLASRDAGYGPTHRAHEAFEAAMTRRGLRPLAAYCDETPLAGRAVVGELFDAEPKLTALVTMNEIATFGIVSELQQRRVAMPERVSILSIVTSPGVGAVSNPPLTTMHAPGPVLGRLGVEKLLSQIDGSRPGTPNVLIPCDLVPGGSVTVAPGEAAPIGPTIPAGPDHQSAR